MSLSAICRLAAPAADFPAERLRLGRVALRLIEQGRLMTHYLAQGPEQSEPFMELPFFTMRLIEELVSNGGLWADLEAYFWPKRGETAVLEVMRQRLADLCNTLALYGQSMPSEKPSDGSPSLIARTASAPAANLQDFLQDLHELPAGAEAVSLWQKVTNTNEAKLETLVDALFSCAKRAKTLPAQYTNMVGGRNCEQLMTLFSGGGRWETVSVFAFSDFLGDERSVAAAVAAHLERTAVEAQIASPTLSAAELRLILHPVEAGDDLVRHHSNYFPGTREWVFQEIANWVKLPKDNENHRVFWLQGTGGLGKSVIAGQLVKRFFQRSDTPWQLAAYVFCKHDDAARNEPRRVVTTVAYWLAMSVPAYSYALSQILQQGDVDGPSLRDLLGGSGTFDQLYDTILLRPLLSVMARRAASAPDVIILIDALDELTGPNRRHILQLIGSNFAQLPGFVRVILTSRPEQDIVAKLEDLHPFALRKQVPAYGGWAALPAEEQPDERELEDLRIFLRAGLMTSTTLVQLSAAEKSQLTEAIIERGDGVFLAVALLAQSITAKISEMDRASTAGLTVDEIERLLAKRTNIIDDTYRTTLKRIEERFVAAADGDADILSQLQNNLADLLAVLVAARRSLRKCDISRWLGRSRGLTEQLLAPLSLLFSAVSESSALEPLHKTVMDYLQDIDPSTGSPHTEVSYGGPRRAGPHYVDATRGHALLAMACLRVLTESGYLPDRAGGKPRLVEPAEIADNAMVQYAIEFGHLHLADCVHRLRDSSDPSNKLQGVASSSAVEEALKQWQTVLLSERKLAPFVALPSHLLLSAPQGTSALGAWILLQNYTTGRKSDFFAELVWCEVLDKTDSSKRFAGLWTGLIVTVREHWLTHKDISTSVTAWVQDIRASSVFWRSECEAWVVQACGADVPLWIRPFKGDLTRESSIITSFEGHTMCVTTVAMSNDGNCIVSGSQDKTVVVWERATDKLRFRLEGHTDVVNTLTVSSDGKRIVGGSRDKMVLVWDAHTGQLMHRLSGHTDNIRAVAVNSDGSRIVSGSNDKTVRVWDGITGNVLRILTDHMYNVLAVAVSSDGKHVISASCDNMARLWDADTGHLLQILEGGTNWIQVVALSNDGSRTFSFLKTRVPVGQTPTGIVLRTAMKHSSGVINAMAASNDGNYIVTASGERVGVWDVATGKLLQHLEHYRTPVKAVAVNSDGSRVVSGCENGTVQLWNVVSAGMQQPQ